MFEQLSLFPRKKTPKKPVNMVPKSSELSEEEVPNNKKALHFMGEKIEVIRRPYQRSISILVKPSGQVRMTCARTTPRFALVKFLNKHKEWLWDTLQAQKNLRSKYPPKRYVMGEEFLYMGDTVYLNFSPTTNKRLKFSVIDDQLMAFIPEDQWSAGFTKEEHPELKMPLIQFYKQQGVKTLEFKLKVISEKMDLKPKKVSYRSQKTRWGSCSSAGNISLNWRLIAAPLETLEYVVIHELAHLEHQNHSKSFWGLVKKYSPQFESHKLWLRDHQFEFDFLAMNSELHKD